MSAVPGDVDTNAMRSPAGDQRGFASIDEGKPNACARRAGALPSLDDVQSFDTPLGGADTSRTRVTVSFSSISRALSTTIPVRRNVTLPSAEICTASDGAPENATF